MRRTLCLAAVALMLTTVPAAAQVKAELSFGGGLTQPSGTFSDVSKTGWHGLATITAFPSSQSLGLQGSLFYGQNKFDVGNGKTKLFGGLGELRLNLKAGQAFTPYVTVGGGLINAKASGGSGSTKGALDGGIGVAYMGAASVGFFVEARYVNVFDSGPDLTFIPVTAGLRIGLK